MALCTGQICVMYLSLFSTYNSPQINNHLGVGDIQKEITTTIASSEEGDIDIIDQLLREKCNRNGGGEEAFNALKKVGTKIESSILDQLIQIERNISTDEVIGKYCRIYPNVGHYIESYLDIAEYCFDAAEHHALQKLLKFYDEINDYLCLDEGEGIETFLAEGGIEFLESQREGWVYCLDEILFSAPNNFDINSLSFWFSDKECRDFDELAICVIAELRTCRNSIPCTMVNRFVKFLKDIIPCNYDTYHNSLLFTHLYH